MKKNIVVLMACLMTHCSFAQTTEGRPTPRLDLKINAGATFTLVPDFNNWLFIAPDGILIPGIIKPGNSFTQPIITESSVTSKSLVGWHVEAEVIYRLPRRYALTFSVGIRELHYDLATTFSHPDFISPVKLDDFNAEFGETTLRYVTISPFNLSRTFVKERLTVQIGPSLNILVKEDYNNVLLLYDDIGEQNPERPDQLFFDNIGEARNLMVGCNLVVSYRIIAPLEIRAATQFLNSPVYTEDGLYYGKPVDDVKPTILQFGITFLPLQLKK